MNRYKLMASEYGDYDVNITADHWKVEDGVLCFYRGEVCTKAFARWFMVSLIEDM